MTLASSWLRRLFRRRPSADVRRVLEAYGACLERGAAAGPYRSERELPYSKEAIGRAILIALKFTDRHEAVEPLRRGFVELERFLPDAERELVANDPRLRDEIDARQARRRQLLQILDEERTSTSR